MKGVKITLIVARVLAAFLRNPKRGRYGLELMKETGLPSGTLYPALARLEAEGWLISARENVDPKKEGRPRRRYYMLTQHGMAVATKEVQGLQEQVSLPLRNSGGGTYIAIPLPKLQVSG